jgi:hypothetical protein
MIPGQPNRWWRPQQQRERERELERQASELIKAADRRERRRLSSPAKTKGRRSGHSAGAQPDRDRRSAGAQPDRRSAGTQRSAGAQPNRRFVGAEDRRSAAAQPDCRSAGRGADHRRRLSAAAQPGRHPNAEHGLDLYETPPAAVEALLRAEQLPRGLWEPASGRGAIVRVLRGAGHDVVASNIVDNGVELDFYADFLTLPVMPAGCEARDHVGPATIHRISWEEQTSGVKPRAADFCAMQR